jgi:hypothetical protein
MVFMISLLSAVLSSIRGALLRLASEPKMRVDWGPRSEVFYTASPHPAAGFPLPISAAPAITTCRGE